jgi:predicted RNase H-like HicB family nuclease
MRTDPKRLADLIEDARAAERRGQIGEMQELILDFEDLLQAASPALEKRPESGVMQFGEDWPGLFLRGDYAVPISWVLESLLARSAHDPAVFQLTELAKFLQSCEVKGQPMHPQRAILVGEGIVATSGRGDEEGDCAGHGTTCEEALQNLGKELDLVIAQRGEAYEEAKEPSKALDVAKRKLLRLFPHTAVDVFRHRCGHSQLATYRPDDRDSALVFASTMDCVKCRPHPWGMSEAEKIALAAQELT